MSKHRHEAEKNRKRGGGVGAIPTKVKEESYAGTGSDTEKEAERRARGGGVHKGRMPTMVHGNAPKHHRNRPGRRSGGSVGADAHPMTSASRLEGREGERAEKLDKEDD